MADGGFTRRDFLQAVGATLAAAGLTGCPPAPDSIVPYTRRPEGLVPGESLHFATGWELDGRGSALLVQSREGRPVKVEGNPEHPVNRGAAGVHDQAALLDLYDPARASIIKQRGRDRSRSQLRESIEAAANRARSDGGARLRFLVEPTRSPLLLSLRERLAAEFPHARVIAYSACADDNHERGMALAFGRPLDMAPRIEAARCILSLGSDFLASGPEGIRDTRGWAERRDPALGNQMVRLYQVEPRLTVTGMNADHRFALRTDEAVEFALGVAARVAAEVDGLAPIREALAWFKPRSDRFAERQLDAIARDLLHNRDRALVLVGPRMPGEVHALAAALNEGLGANRTIVQFSDPLTPDVSTGPAALASLVAEMRASSVDTLVITAWNPVYTAPADLDFAAALDSVPHAFYHSLHADETAPRVEWFVPAAHFLESWGDLRAPDGTVTLTQPLIAPLFNGLSTPELLSMFLPEAPTVEVAGARGEDVGFRSPTGTSMPLLPSLAELRQEPRPPQAPTPSPLPVPQPPGAYSLLRAQWSSANPARGAAIDNWNEALQAGFVANSAATPVKVAARIPAVAASLGNLIARQPSNDIELDLYPDHATWDGRFGNNPWLQELPEPTTSLTWDNALYLGPATARRLSLANEDVVEIVAGGRAITAPVLVAFGHAEHCASLTLGRGRDVPNLPHAHGSGANAYLLRTSQAPWVLDVRLKPTGGKYPLSLTQGHTDLEGRPIALQLQLDGGNDLVELRAPLPSLYSAVEYKGHKWGMAIDLNRCVGCGACVIGCQSENNVPWVGRAEVRRGREMHWLRVDRYEVGHADGPGADPTTANLIPQPMFCVHCENAPCEYVCPVNATVHSDEGLNEMVYNRCVGTRYCSNNCPYKVRRFNYLDFHPDNTMVPTIRMAQNPEVTVRSRGVMEKCTYCVQRIEHARIAARRDNAADAPDDFRGDSIQTACQQTCPAKAIVFGDLNQRGSQLVALHEDPRAYEVLHELNTRPRTRHLARVKNPNPELA